MKDLKNRLIICLSREDPYPIISRNQRDKSCCDEMYSKVFFKQIILQWKNPPSMENPYAFYFGIKESPEEILEENNYGEISQNDCLSKLIKIKWLTKSECPYCNRPFRLILCDVFPMPDKEGFVFNNRNLMQNAIFAARQILKHSPPAGGEK